MNLLPSRLKYDRMDKYWRKVLSFIILMLDAVHAGFPRGIELWNRFKTLKKYWIWQNVHEVLKKYGNSEFNHLFRQIFFFTTDDISADVFLQCREHSTLDLSATITKVFTVLFC